MGELKLESRSPYLVSLGGPPNWVCFYNHFWSYSHFWSDYRGLFDYILCNLKYINKTVEAIAIDLIVMYYFNRILNEEIYPI